MITNYEFGLEVAETLIRADDNEWPAIVRELRRSKRFSRAMNEIDKLARDPAHSEMAVQALRRVGLYDL